MDTASVVQIHTSAGYDSDFEDDLNIKTDQTKVDVISVVSKKRGTVDHSSTLPSKRRVCDEYEKEEAKVDRMHFLALDAYSRHKVMVNNYMKYYGGTLKDFERTKVNDRNDYDVLREQHRFVWEDEDEVDHNWEKRLAKKYYDRLYKEYCIADLSKYKSNKIALRWRIEREVLSGKGQFLCGSLKCGASDDLRSWEVNFGYIEHGGKKNALVKLRLCPECSDKLNYHHKRRLAKSKINKEQRIKVSKDLDECSESREKDNPNSSDNKETSEDLSEASQSSTKTDNVWSRPINIESKTREDEFEDYFQDMLL